jgi:putative inorganic carbon (HCO3(-)) transporter
MASSLAVEFREPLDRGMRAVEFCLALVAAGGVLAFGGVSATVFLPLGMVVVLLACWLFWSRGFPQWPPVAVAIAALAIALPLVQLIPLPTRLVAFISPARASLHEVLWRSLPSGSAWLPLSVNSWATAQALLKLTCFVCVFLLACESRRRLRSRSLLPTALIAIGVFEAAYGAIQYLTHWQFAFTASRIYSTEVAKGTFTNRNHLAGLLAMILPFCLARIVSRWYADPQGQGSARRSNWQHALSDSLLAVVVGNTGLFAILAIGLVFSQSRMGIVAAAAGILVVLALVFIQAHRRWIALTVALLVVGLAGSYCVWIGIDPVVGRFMLLAGPGGFEEGRGSIWRDTAPLIRDYPLVGTGLGTYASAVIHYQTADFGVLYVHAHNDYLEFAADGGVPFAVLLFGGLWALALKLALRVPLLARREERGDAAALVGAMCAMLIHSLAEFNLQIPANAFIFSAISGSAAGMLFGTTIRNTGAKRPAVPLFRLYSA